jgi:hypothetical protein
MLRTTILTAAVLTALVATNATAGDYSDTANNFRVTVPEGWVPDTPQNPLIKLKVFSPRVAETHGGCTVITNLEPETKASSQADIDASGEKTVDEAFWLSGLKKAKYVDDVTIETTGVKMINGHKAYVVVANLSATVPNVGPVKVKTQQMIEAIPGQFFIVTCTASDTGYAQEESDFNIVFNSFAPLSDAPVAALESNGVSSLTMYSLPRFGGVSRIVTQDAPNLAVFGWRATTASVSVAGAGAWEVCDGANYSGRCQTITAALPTGPDGKALTIASARHVKAMLPSQARRSDMSEALAASYEGALRR